MATKRNEAKASGGGAVSERTILDAEAAMHELNWAGDGLWATDRGHERLLKLDPDFQILHSVPLKLRRAHGVVGLR